VKGLSALELRVTDKLRRIDYDTFQNFNPELIYATIGGDKYTAIVAARFLIPTMAAFVVVILTGLYLCTVSIPGALCVAAVLVALIKIRGLLDTAIGGRGKDDAAATDKFTVSLNDVVAGFNELKMNRRKSDALFNYKVRTASGEKGKRILGTELYRTRSIVLEQAILFLPLGLTLFVLPSIFKIDAQDLVKIISVTLIVIWPAYTLVQFGPISTAAADIIDKLRDFEAQLDETELEPDINDPADYPSAPKFTRITCRNIGFEYPKRPGDTKPFVLKVEEFHLDKGQIVIMCGGNGSGKSTFMRLLAGLTKPSEGTVTVDGASVAEIGEANYRALFALVMADFHLFDRFYGNENIDADRSRNWAAKLGLEDKVMDKGELPTVSLSSGQKKRMALLAAIMDNRPVLLLDEVAADFDPFMRERYYREILPELKAKGFTLFVISHDDRYYDIADCILTMREGGIADPGSK
ncbi:MAG: ATP-binding cassette domain-containing protein, partial [Treponema sp.]|nr:ATP-binding cassette domain-containing protein [Treponema sp.]